MVAAALTTELKPVGLQEAEATLQIRMAASPRQKAGLHSAAGPHTASRLLHPATSAPAHTSTNQATNPAAAASATSASNTVSSATVRTANTGTHPAATSTTASTAGLRPAAQPAGSPGGRTAPAAAAAAASPPPLLLPPPRALAPSTACSSVSSVQIPNSVGDAPHVLLLHSSSPETGDQPQQLHTQRLVSISGLLPNDRCMAASLAGGPNSTIGSGLASVPGDGAASEDAYFASTCRRSLAQLSPRRSISLLPSSQSARHQPLILQHQPHSSPAAEPHPPTHPTQTQPTSHPHPHITQPQAKLGFPHSPQEARSSAPAVQKLPAGTLSRSLVKEDDASWARSPPSMTSRLQGCKGAVQGAVSGAPHCDTSLTHINPTKIAACYVCFSRNSKISSWEGSAPV